MFKVHARNWKISENITISNYHKCFSNYQDVKNHTNIVKSERCSFHVKELFLPDLRFKMYF